MGMTRGSQIETRYAIVPEEKNIGMKHNSAKARDFLEILTTGIYALHSYRFFRRKQLTPSSVLSTGKTEAAYSYRMSVRIYKTSWCHIPEYIILNGCHCDKIKPCI
jgi:hypothetical protein